MTTRREFIKIAAGTLAMISLPMGLLIGEEKKPVTKVSRGICKYYLPTVIIKEYKIGEVLKYEDYSIDPNCGRCTHYSKCPVIGVRVEEPIKYDN